MVKVTFTLDELTVAAIRKLAERQKKPQSMVVREAISHYAAKEELLTPGERDHFLKVLHELGPKLPVRSREDVDHELQQLRVERRSGGRLHPGD
jgi:hypothetical protein